MKISKIENAPLTGLKNLDDVFAWPGATLKFIGEGFGQKGLHYVALAVGLKKWPLLVKSWSDKEIVAEVPADIPSRGYRLAIYREPHPPTGSKPVTTKLGAAISGSAIKAKPVLNEPVDARLVNTGTMTRLLNSFAPVSNVMTLFVSLGPIKPGTDGFQATYRTQIEQYAAKHGLSSDWINYMFIANQFYLLLFNKFKMQYDDELVVSYTYGPDGSKGIKTPFESEEKHMELLRKIFQSLFVGPPYRWRVVFGSTNEPYVRILGLTTPPIPGVAGEFEPNENIIYAKADGVIAHELFHKIGMKGHHYENQPTIAPNEKCIFNSDGLILCHGCCAVAGIDYHASMAGFAEREKLAIELSSHFFPSV